MQARTAHLDLIGPGIPEWHRDGLCARPGQDPRRWDADDDRRTSRAQKLVRAQKACTGCPVIRECAAEALDHGSVGVVRAGIELAGKPSPGARQALTGIANHGVEPVLAAITFAGTSPTLAAAVGPLQALAARAGVEVPGDYSGAVGA